MIGFGLLKKTLRFFTGRYTTCQIAPVDDGYRVDIMSVKGLKTWEAQATFPGLKQAEAFRDMHIARLKRCGLRAKAA